MKTMQLMKTLYNSLVFVKVYFHLASNNVLPLPPFPRIMHCFLPDWDNSKNEMFHFTARQDNSTLQLNSLIAKTAASTSMNFNIPKKVFRGLLSRFSTNADADLDKDF